MVANLPPAARLPLFAAAFVALALGAAGGLARLGVAFSVPTSAIAWHGALMASGFFGTLIALERAVALARAWAYAAPAASGVAALALLFGYAHAAFALFIVGGVLFAAASIMIWFRQRALHTALLAAGALALLVANIGLALGAGPASVAPSWLAFLVLTIGGERLELSRLLPLSTATRLLFAALAVALFAASLCAFGAPRPAMRGIGVLTLACAAWLARHDIATRTVRGASLTRFIAACLLAGYVWLAVGGAALALSADAAADRAAWDLALHAVMIGFVFSMVFGHAPVILPAVLRVALPYRAVLYVPLAALHLTLALRVAGDLLASAPLRAAGAAGNVASIALFVLVAAALVASARAGGRKPVTSR
jgi:hypothetical protein